MTFPITSHYFPIFPAETRKVKIVQFRAFTASSCCRRWQVFRGLIFNTWMVNNEVALPITCSNWRNNKASSASEASWSISTMTFQPLHSRCWPSLISNLRYQKDAPDWLVAAESLATLTCQSPSFPYRIIKSVHKLPSKSKQWKKSIIQWWPARWTLY